MNNFELIINAPSRIKNARSLKVSYIFFLGIYCNFTNRIVKPPIKIIALTIEITSPIFEPANECTEKSPKMPDRVKNVPYITNEYVKIAARCVTGRTAGFDFDKFIKCSKTALNSHGTSDEFSTGSQPQYPPQPSTL